jgi:hypothetical protein
MADLLAEQRRDIDKRLAQLRPQVEEYTRLEQAVAALAGIESAPTAPAGRAPRKAARGGRRESAAVAAASTVAKPRKVRAKRSGRPKGGGRRALEALAVVKGQPGITIPEIATKMGIKQNYLYRVLPALAKEKKLRKDGKGWHTV